MRCLTSRNEGYYTAGVLSSITPFKIVIVPQLQGSGEMAQQLGAFASPEDLNSILGTYMATSNPL